MARPLELLKTLSADRRERLVALGITSVEELLGRARSPEARALLEGYVGLGTGDMSKVLSEAATLVSQDVLNEFAKPVARHKRGGLPPRGPTA